MMKPVATFATLLMALMPAAAAPMPAAAATMPAAAATMPVVKSAQCPPGHVEWRLFASHYFACRRQPSRRSCTAQTD